MATGVKEKDAGSFLGGLRKKSGDAIALEVVAAAINESPSDPREWMTAAAKQRAEGTGMEDLTDEEMAAAQERIRAKREALGSRLEARTRASGDVRRARGLSH